MYRIRLWNDDCADDIKAFDHQEMDNGLAIETECGWDIWSWSDFDYYDVL